MTFMEQLKSIDNVTDINSDEEYLIEFYLTHQVLKEEILITFDDFDIKDISDQEKILTSTNYLVDNFIELMGMINSALIIHIKNNYKLNIEYDCLLKDIHETFLTFIRFSPEDEFGTCCIGFNSRLEVEHGLGLVLKQWKVDKIGFADICYSS